MVRYECPNCRLKLESQNSDIGKSDFCPACQHKFVVPCKPRQHRKLFATILVIFLLGGLATGAISFLDFKNIPTDTTEHPEQTITDKNQKTLPSSKTTKTLPFAKLYHFKDLLNDYGAVQTKSTVNFNNSKVLKSYTLNENLATGAIIITEDKSGNITGLCYLFGFDKKNSLFQNINTLYFCLLLLKQCPNWEISSDNTFGAFVKNFIDSGKKRGEGKDVDITQNIDGLKISMAYSKNFCGTLSISLFEFAKKRHPSPPKYKPIYFGEKSLIGLWDIDWKKVEDSEYFTTVSWRVTIANKSSVKCKYSLTCSFQDKQGFEIQKDYANVVPIASGKQMKFTSSTHFSSTKAKKIHTINIIAQAYPVK